MVTAKERAIRRMLAVCDIKDQIRFSPPRKRVISPEMRIWIIEQIAEILACWQCPDDNAFVGALRDVLAKARELEREQS